MASSSFFVLLMITATAHASETIDLSDERICRSDLGEVVALNGNSWVRPGLTPAIESDRFRFVVHATDDTLFMTESASTKRLLLNETNAAIRGGQLSATIIDENHTNTFGCAGMILNPRNDNVLANEPQDLLSLDNGGPRFNFAYRALHPTRLSPGELLRRTETKPAVSAKDWNELILVDPNREGIAVYGLFLRVDSLGNSLCSQRLVNEVHRIGERFGVPVVKIGPPKGFATVLFGWNVTSNSRRLQVHGTKVEVRNLQKQMQSSGHPVLGIAPGKTRMAPFVEGYFTADGFTHFFFADRYDGRIEKTERIGPRRIDYK